MSVRPTLADGEASHKAGDLIRAEEFYRAVLQSDPAEARAWFLLGAVCLSAGRLEEAASSLRRSLRLRPEHAASWNLLGVSHAGLGRPDEAEACFRRVLQIQPGHAEAARNLQRARRAQGSGAIDPDFDSCCRRAYELCQQARFAEAEVWYREALRIRPESADVLSDLGKVLVLLSRPEEGASAFRRAIAVDPGHARAHLNLASTLFELDRLDEAAAAAQRAVQLEPGNPTAYNNVGLILNQASQLSAAEGAYRDGLRLAPDHPELHVNLANLLVLEGRAEEAQAHYRRALELKPAFPSAHSNWLLSRQCLPDVTLAALAEAHREWDIRHAEPLRSTWRPFANRPDPERPLRLGFVSADFHRHPVGTFLIRTMEALRSLECETHCYHTRQGSDDLVERFARAATAWRPCRDLPDVDLAELIRDDRIDVLFDLAGHTSKNRLLVFARRPAPIQLTWLGYAGTTGLSAIDYLVADSYQVPPRTERFYTEQVIRLPDGYACYDPPDQAPDVGPPPALTSGSVTFGCFNSPAKIGPAVIAAWAEILARLPSSRLLLKYRGLDDAAVRGRYRDAFSGRGIDPARVELEGYSPIVGMLAAYGRVDLALDPFPYSGGLTTCEALWMGVPVVTHPGETFAGRHALSHVSNAGLTGTVARDRTDYVEIAVGLASDLPRLADLRAGLRPRMAAGSLCDGPRLARHLLDALRVRWREWCTARV